MPRRTRRSLAATKRNQQTYNGNTNNSSDIMSTDHVLIRGKFHQGDSQIFSTESVGRQCSCNALVMLCTIHNVFDTLMPCHLDQVLKHGDQLYINRCQELEAAGMLAEDKLLDQSQLPDYFTIDDKSYIITYKHENFKHGKVTDDYLQLELNTALKYVFTVSHKLILILDGYMMAVYKHTGGQYMQVYSVII